MNLDSREDLGLFRELAEHSPQMVFITQHGRVVYANQRCHSIMGYPAGVLRNGDVPFMDLVAPESRGSVRRHLREHIKGTGVPRSDYVLLTADGRKLQATVTTRRVSYDGAGAVLGIVQDISELHELKTQVRHERARAQRYLDVAPVIFLAVDADGTIGMINRAGAQCLGYRVDELVGANVLTSITPVDQQEATRVRLLEWTDGTCPVADSDTREVLTRAGARRLIQWHNSILRDETGEAYGVLSCGVDVTEQHRLTRALEESEQRFRDIYERAPIGIFRTTPEGHVLMANPALLDMLRYDSLEDLASVNVETRGYHADTPRQTFKDAVEATGSVRGFEAKWLRKDGSVLHVRENARAVRDKEGKTLYYEGTIEDVTRQKEVEEALAYQMRFQLLLTEVSRRFVNVSPLEVDKAIRWALRKLGEFSGCDRSYVLQFDESLCLVSHEWHDARTGAKTDELGTAPCRIMPWTRDRIAAGNAVCVPDLEAAPVESETDAMQWRAEEIQSLLMVPLVCGERVYGALGFDSVWEKRAWSSEDVRRLCLVGEIFASALDRKRIEEELRYRLECEELITSLSARFIDVSPEEIDGAVESVLKDLAETVGVDQGVVYVLSEREDMLERTHAWTAGRTEITAPATVPIEDDGVPWELDLMRRLEVLNVPSSDTLPDEAHTMRRYMEANALKSFLCVPFPHAGGRFGFLGFASTEEETEWTEQVVSMLQLMGDIIGRTLQRKDWGGSRSKGES